MISGEALFTSHSQQLAALTVRHAVPTVYKGREFAAAGGLMSYGTDIADAYRLAGDYTGRILKGDQPVDLFYAALRILLPSYDGPDRQLFRGQLASEPVGLSWTRSHHIAVKFALYGMENVDANNLIKARIAGIRRFQRVPALRLSGRGSAQPR